MKTWVRKTLKVGVLSAGLLLIGGAAAASAAHANTSNNFGLATGNQVVVPVQIPINISGNAIGVLGGASAMSHGAGAAHAMVSPFLFPHLGTGGNFGIL